MFTVCLGITTVGRRVSCLLGGRSSLLFEFICDQVCVLGFVVFSHPETIHVMSMVFLSAFA